MEDAISDHSISVQQYLPGLILSTILNTIKEMDDPYQARPGLGGMTAYPPKAMAVVCIMMEAEMKTYRKMVGYLRMPPGSCQQDRAVRDTLQEHHMARLRPDPRVVPARGSPEDHRRHRGRFVGRGQHRLLRQPVRPLVQHPPQQVKTKRGWIKLHSIIDIATRAILDYHVTDGYTSDITGMWPMLDRLADGNGNFC